MRDLCGVDKPGVEKVSKMGNSDVRQRFKREMNAYQRGRERGLRNK